MIEKKNKKKDHPEEKSLTPTAFLEYASHIGSAVIRPEDRGKIKGNALKAMYHQTDDQFLQLKKQFDLLVAQAQELQNRVSVSEQIYETKLNFEPVIHQTYYLYQREDQTNMLSMIGPEEWGSGFTGTYVAKVKLLADHTWQVLHKTEGPEMG